jgi:hypothetical protein
VIEPRELAHGERESFMVGVQGFEQTTLNAGTRRRFRTAMPNGCFASEAPRCRQAAAARLCSLRGSAPERRHAVAAQGA